jgi:hypothetical protein
VKPLSTKIHADSLKTEKIVVKDIREKTLELYIQTDLAQTELFSTSQVMFGDTITNYVNKVAKNIIKYNPELNNIGLEFYINKTDIVNAGAYCNKVIFVDLGLIAYLDNEAELAFVICHEISHVIREHSVKGVEERYELEEQNKKNKRKQKATKARQIYIDELFKKSALQEYEADSLGYIYFSNTNYDPAAVTSQLTSLHLSDFSYGTTPFSPEWMDLKNFKMPREYFLESTSAIKPLQDENDRYSTHPNIFRRVNKVKDYSKTRGKGKLLMEATSTREVEYVRELARFERIRLLINSKQYGDAIYESYCLLKTHPDNEYLNTNIAKAFYALAKYKNVDEFPDVARPYKEIEGESQQIHYFLKQLDRKQLNAYAYIKIKNCSEKYPKNELLKQLKNDLIKDLVLENKLKQGDLVYMQEEDPRKFYKQLLKDDMEDKTFVASLESNYPLLEKRLKEDVIPTDKLEEIKKDEEEKRKKDGPKLFAKQITVCEPAVIFIGRKRKYDIVKTNELYQKVMHDVKTFSDLNGVSVSMIDNKYVEDKGVSNYNNRARIMEWLEERLSHNEMEVLPLTSDLFTNSYFDNHSKYVCYIQVYFNEKTFYSVVSVRLFDIKTSKEELSYITENTLGVMNYKKVNNTLEDFFKTVKQ